MLLFVLGSVCIVAGWSMHGHLHTSWYSQSQTSHTFLSYLYVYLSKQNMLANQNLHVYNTQSCTIVGELASSPMEGSIVWACGIPQLHVMVISLFWYKTFKWIFKEKKHYNNKAMNILNNFKLKLPGYLWTK